VEEEWGGMSEHGTHSKYVRGCRCELCREAKREYDRSYRLRKSSDVYVIKSGTCHATVRAGSLEEAAVKAFKEAPDGTSLGEVMWILHQGKKTYFSTLDFLERHDMLGPSAEEKLKC
jgi:hypothetical protein